LTGTVPGGHIKRTSINAEGFKHSNPIPAASRIGNLLISGGIHGIDPKTGKLAPTIEEQVALVFTHMRNILKAGGARPEDVIKVTVWLTDRSQRDLVNAEWVQMFPEEYSRPARHTMRG